MTTSNPFDNFHPSEFSDNPEPRCAVVLLLDTSSSMSGRSISELNHGLVAFQHAIQEDALARLRVDVSIITFDSRVTEISLSAGTTNDGTPRFANYVNADDFVAPVLETSGSTQLYQGLSEAIESLRKRKAVYRTSNPPVDYYRPWIILITDGNPDTDAARSQIIQKVHEGIRNREFTLFAIGVEGANMSVLHELVSSPPPLKLTNLAFRELFQWLSSSLKSVSQSKPNTTGLMLPAPTSNIIIDI